MIRELVLHTVLRPDPLLCTSVPSSLPLESSEKLPAAASTPAQKSLEDFGPLPLTPLLLPWEHTELV